MAGYLNKSAIVECGHQGVLQFVPQPTRTFIVNGSEIVLRSDVLLSPIVGCTWVGPGKIPCVMVTSLLQGEASDIEVDGDVPLLDSLRFMTNGNGPPGTVVRDNSNSDAETLEERGSPVPRPDSNWDLARMEWSRQEVRPGDGVLLKVDFTGVPDGTPVMLAVYPLGSAPDPDPVLRTQEFVSGGRVRREWAFVYEGDIEQLPTEEEARREGRHYSPPEYFFTARLCGRTFGQKHESGLLRYLDSLDLQVVDAGTGDPISGLDYEITLPNGEQVTGKLDREGRVHRDRVLPGRWTIRFPNAAAASGSEADGAS